MATETEWRRRWKPNLAAFPWKNVDVDGETLLIKTKFSDKSYEVLITDLTSFWYETLEEKALKQRLAKLNPSIEAPISKILDQIKQNVENPAKGIKLAVSFKQLADNSGQKLSLKITSSLSGMPFVWNFQCGPADSAMARDHLTVPLLAMVSELFRRQQELAAILAAKDKEIDDYRSQGVRASRKHIETPKFDAIAFNNSMVTSKGFEEHVKKLETAAFETEGQELYRQVATKHAWLVHKAAGDSAEEMSEEEESITMSNQGPQSTMPSWTNLFPPSLVPSKETTPAKTPTASPTKSPVKTESPGKSPGSKSSASDASPNKDIEKQRREELEKRLEIEEQKKQEKKKKKKLAF